MNFRKRWARPFRDIAMIAAGLAALSFLPPDTSLSEREAVGSLRFCVPSLNSALLRDPQTGEPAHELQLMQSVADGLGLTLRVVENGNMGRSFNPADWHISRGQCDVLGGGLADTPTNRGFLTLLPTGERIGLVLTVNEEPPTGSEVGVFMGSAGLDRVKLSAWMRGKGWRAKPIRDAGELSTWIAAGKPAIASTLNEFPAGTVQNLLPDEASTVSDLAFGLWRGDMTLTRAVREQLTKHRNK